MTAAEVLSVAALRAENAKTLRKAIATAWSALHTDTVDVMAGAFDAWCAAEDYGSHASGLGGVLRRRYDTPGEIAGSLRRAAELAP